MKKSFKYLLTIMCMSLMVGCGQTTDGNSNTPSNPTENATKNTTEDTSQDAVSNSNTDTSFEVSTPSNQNGSDSFSFKNINDLEFVFSSGVGAWQTYLNIQEDGSFSGVYSDSDMGDTADLYPNGTIYYCNFNGQFTNLKQINDYTYSFELESIEFADNSETEEIADGVRLIYTQAYGLEDCTEFKLYLPQTPVYELSEEVRIWLHLYNFSGDKEETLGMYAIENTAKEYGFDSYTLNPVYTTAMESVNKMNEELGGIYAKIGQCKSQWEINQVGKEAYELVDNELNYIWGLIKENLSDTAYETILDEQRQWIKDKEAAVEETGNEYGPGTMRPAAEYDTATEMTKDRIAYLIEYLR